MKTCDHVDCNNWAQWRAIVMNGETRFFCQIHKEALNELMARDPEFANVKIAFVGAVPHGLNCS